MLPTSEDKLAASVFALGLTFGFVRREDVVRWADRRIMEIYKPPIWLIDLSLFGQERQWIDLISDLNDVAKGVDPLAVCKLALSLLPETNKLSFDEAEAMARLVYHLTQHCGWDNTLFREADRIDDTFSLLRGGIIAMTRAQAILELTAFIEANRDESMAHVLRPVVQRSPWSDA